MWGFQVRGTQKNREKSESGCTAMLFKGKGESDLWTTEEINTLIQLEMLLVVNLCMGGWVWNTSNGDHTTFKLRDQGMCDSCYITMGGGGTMYYERWGKHLSC
jgi:hypothetical protein